ncbi:hypothetical protein [Caulobacter rhizosphaerae]|uniref:hypothetical protein n=1 Tax=Caulobacter rhizosphaerae TaxID=2010972 RepID=UPI0013D11428|nr:hypothetical protein [Caulobacter rhizosphaerae]GGL48566.1 hypothetical protein GCM10010983_52380 [Caulobacter rhizosphaerae]
MKNALYGAIGAFLVVLLVGLVGARVEVSSLTKDRDRWRSSAGEYLKAAGAWEASYRSASSKRADEGQRAITATNLAALACDARVAAARRSAGAIQTIVSKDPIYDEAHCPVRRSVGFDLLRDATGAPTR